ncbi:ANK-REP-region domain-containing protein [Favolaschia claudopus]|uniref:ANK-REP-region domain-containing protein n=1 Tax=Favolaschia claudopus TaxID=2862362 RepID=A0AAW0D5Y8_9AGAR
MAVLLDLPPELILHIVSFLHREKVLIDKDNDLSDLFNRRLGYPEIVPDLPSINAFSQTNTALYPTLNRYIYNICAKHDATIGKLSLLSAGKFGSERALDKLVAAGVSLDAEFFLKYRACSILHVAAARGQRVMVIKLLEMYGTEMEVKVHARRGTWLVKATALDYAARYGHLETVQLLASVPVPSSVSDSTKERRTYLSSALLHSVQASVQGGSTEIPEFLVSQGADVNDRGAARDAGGTALYFAVGTDNLELVQFLLSAGADPNLCVGGSIPLFNAAQNYSDDLDIAETLLAAGADLNKEDGNLRNVLFSCTDIVPLEFFLKRGVDVNLEDSVGETPLHHACSQQDAVFALDCVELLLQYGATTVEQANRMGQTPLTIAIGQGYNEIVELLKPLIYNSALKDMISMWLEDNKYNYRNY